MDNKVAIVTGGAKGIGKKLVERLLSNGYSVGIIDLNSDQGQKTSSELNERFGDHVLFVACDVTDGKKLEESFEKIKKHFGGKLDLVVNNAGMIDEGNWEAQVDVNLKAVIRGTYLGINLMSKTRGNNGGVIINTASVAGLFQITIPVYTATKHAVVGFTRALAETPYFLETDGIRINCVCLGFVDTDILTTNVVPTDEKRSDRLTNCVGELKRVWNDMIEDHRPKFIPVEKAVDTFMEALNNEELHGKAVFIINDDQTVRVSRVAIPPLSEEP